MFAFEDQMVSFVSDCIPDQGSGGQCSQCTDCNCVDGDDG